MTLFDYLCEWYGYYIFNTGGDYSYLLDLSFNVGDATLTLCDWLSGTATIITLCLLVAFLFLCVRYLFKVAAGLFTLRG